MLETIGHMIAHLANWAGHNWPLLLVALAFFTYAWIAGDIGGRSRTGTARDDDESW